MNNLIKRSDAFEMLHKLELEATAEQKQILLQAIGCLYGMEAADARIIQYGRWDKNPLDPTERVCSICNGTVWGWHQFAECRFTYCPWCGAEMEVAQ